MTEALIGFLKGGALRGVWLDCCSNGRRRTDATWIGSRGRDKAQPCRAEGSTPVALRLNLDG